MTRLYMLTLLVTFSGLLFYNIFTEHTKIYTVYYPTEAIYERLLSQYNSTIQCPCTHIAIPNEKFISGAVQFHHICSTEFMSDAFINQLFSFRDINVYRGGFMQISGPYFSGIRTFCSLSQIFFARSLAKVQTNLFVNEMLLSPDDFEAQAADQSLKFLVGALKSFRKGVQTLIDFTANNQALSVSSTLYDLQAVSNKSIQVYPGSIGNCSCLLNPLICAEPASFYSYNSSTDSFTQIWTVMGIQVACFPLLSIIQSNLACWYSSDCYEKVKI